MAETLNKEQNIKAFIILFSLFGQKITSMQKNKFILNFNKGPPRH